MATYKARIPVEVTKEENDAITAAAKSVGKSKAAFLRDLGLKEAERVLKGKSQK